MTQNGLHALNKTFSFELCFGRKFNEKKELKLSESPSPLFLLLEKIAVKLQTFHCHPPKNQSEEDKSLFGVIIKGKTNEVVTVTIQ